MRSLSDSQKIDLINQLVQKDSQGSVKLSWKKLNQRDLKYLAGHKSQNQIDFSLKELYLEFNQLGKAGVYELSQGRWEHLNFLNLASNRITAKGVRFLTKMDCPMLETLGLMSNQLGNEGILNLSKANWKNLSILNITSNQIENKGLLYLTKGYFKGLVWLQIYRNHITEAGFLHFMRADWPHLCKIQSNHSWCLMKNTIDKLKIKFEKLEENEFE